MIRAIPSNASDNIYCTLLAQSAVHGAMAGFTGFTVGPVNSRHAYIPINVYNPLYGMRMIIILGIGDLRNLAAVACGIKEAFEGCRVTETTNTVNMTGRMWARLLASTNQPSFVNHQTVRERVDKETIDAINNMKINST
ncbi:hypothetical protein H5410_016364 [Solanum commersonii]|uniref:Phosphofructokinase n=1 Tax=Solanum commersonii TaxID=4109 RepID=A0A9J5ZX61_SOLCO|nr:hypothetical protein H5410_016364 [Solanum commersonii]